MAALVLFPLAFPLLCGYVVLAVRASRAAPSDGPPAWRLSAKLLADGFWAGLLAALVTAPFAAAFWPLSLALFETRGGLTTHDAFFDRAYALLAAGALLALPWGLVLLLAVPAGLARYAWSGRPLDLFDLAGSLRLARANFAEWNLVLATIVTAWGLGLAAAGLVCLGFIPGAFYAILVSAYATSWLPAEPGSQAAPAPTADLPTG